MENSLNSLLSKLYENLHIAKKKEFSEFNIFNVLGVENKEVILCRFIGAILDPNGSHGLGSYPLELFIRDVLGDNDFSSEDASDSDVVLEDNINNDRRVDIVIYTKKQVYPIEVKIWAEDQDAQLSDYYRYYFGKDSDKKIYYLTPFGWNPSKISQGELKSENIECLSFVNDIRFWLEKLLMKRYMSNDNVRSSIHQFVNVIYDMGRDMMNNAEIEKVLGISDGNIQYTNELKAAVALLKNSENIYKKIKENYLRNNLVFDKSSYKISGCTKNDLKKDSHALLKIVLKNDPDITVAWICVHTNLYMVCEKTKKSSKEWKKSKDDYSWRYIKPSKCTEKSYNMSSDWNEYYIEADEINIDAYLSDINLDK